MELPPAVASEVLSSAVSPSAELLSSEIKTFVNFIAQQWCWVTTWEEKQEWADDRAGGNRQLSGQPCSSLQH